MPFLASSLVLVGVDVLTALIEMLACWFRSKRRIIYRAGCCRGLNKKSPPRQRRCQSRHDTRIHAVAMKGRRPGALVWFNLVLAACPPFLWAQSINSGTVTGTVKDPSGAVVDGARVILRNLVSGYEQTTVTDGFGAFRL